MAMPKFAPAATREAHKAEIADLEMIVDPNSAKSLDSSRFVDSERVNPRKARRKLEEEKQRLKRVTPRALHPRQRQAAVERLKLLETALVKGSPEHDIPAMNSRQQQWQASDADVGNNYNWSEFWKAHNLSRGGRPERIDKSKQQGAIWEWMDLRRQVLREDDERGDPGVASIESIRPDEKLTGAARSIHAPWAGISFERYNAIMGGKTALSKIQFQVLEAEIEGTARARSPEEMAPASIAGPFTCGADTANGTPCGMRVSQEGDRCFNHSPSLALGREEDE